MENVFRFVLTRPARELESDAVVPLTTDSPFQAELQAAAQTARPLVAMKAAARNFAGTPPYVVDPDALRSGPALRGLELELAALGDLTKVDAGALEASIRKALDALQAQGGEGAERVGEERTRLADSIVAIKLLPDEHHRPVERLARRLRDLELLASVARDARLTRDGRRVAMMRARPMELPQSLAPPSAREFKKRDRRPEAPPRPDPEFEARLAAFQATNRAVEELIAMSPLWLQATLEAASPAVEPGPTATVSERPGLLGGLLSRSGLAPGQPRFQPDLAREQGFRLTREGVGRLSTTTREVLAARGLDPAGQSLEEVVQVLRADLAQVASALDRMTPVGIERNVASVGRAMLYAAPPTNAWTDISVGGRGASTRAAPAAAAGSIPTSHGTIAPVGVADLLVVKQQLVRYEAVDIAHIENVLKGEAKLREHRRTQVTEETILRETEITTTEERDLESTDRFEMSREASEVVKEDAALKAGLTVTGKYGPTVEFSASAEGSVSRSKEEATKHAENYSREVTARSSRKVTERVLQRQTLRITNEVEEKNRHELDNKGGPGHVIGIYQWIEKLYQAQIFNYGLRTMFDFMVPEPAAFVIAGLKSAYAEATGLTKPAPFTLKPGDITEFNYGYWVLQYEATGVNPPPEMYLTKTADANATSIGQDASFNNSQQIAVDDGYEAIYGYVGYVGNIWKNNYSLDALVGSRTHRFDANNGWVWGTSLDNERGSVPIALNTFKMSDIAVGVEIKCRRTDRAMAKWRHDTHATLVQAYEKLLSEYEEKLAALKAQAGVEISGRNPASNREMIGDELKKSCIAILTQQHFDLFDAVETGGYGLPQADLAEAAAEGPYVRFFEHAFEWDNIVYVFYPYFWGRKSEWVERLNYEDTDPLFAQFLKAGYCRVVVPVRPGFEGAVDHFMHFGEPWFGGPLPPISSELYLPIAQELAEQLGRPGNELPEGDPWEVRVPTTLIKLRADQTLPSWTQDAQGRWIPN